MDSDELKASALRLQKNLADKENAEAAFERNMSWDNGTAQNVARSNYKHNLSRWFAKVTPEVVLELLAENAALKAQLTEVERDRDMMQACLSTPELYVGVVTEACESHWAELIREARSELTDAIRDCDIRDAQLAGLKVELAEIRKAAAGLEAYLIENRWIGDRGWMISGYPEAELEALTAALDTAPSTPEGADDAT